MCLVFLYKQSFCFMYFVFPKISHDRCAGSKICYMALIENIANIVMSFRMSKIVAALLKF